MLLAVALLLLLPVMMAGATYGLPGAGCVSHSCCALHHCCAHELQSCLEQGKCAEHDHRHHYHERLQLMREDARRADCAAPAVVEKGDEWSHGWSVESVSPTPIPEPGGALALYGGYLRPLRC